MAAVEGGLISKEEACERYDISDEEFSSWRSAVTRHGLKGLCVTRLTHFRSAFE